MHGPGPKGPGPGPGTGPGAQPGGSSLPISGVGSLPRGNGTFRVETALSAWKQAPSAWKLAPSAWECHFLATFRVEAARNFLAESVQTTIRVTIRVGIDF